MGVKVVDNHTAVTPGIDELRSARRATPQSTQFKRANLAR
jgi:hypothetical protein